MKSETESAPSAPPGATRRRLIALAIGIAVVLAGFGTYVYLANRTSGTTLTVYTYGSLLGGANCGAPAWSTAFDAFAQAHQMQFNIVCPSGTLLNTLIGQQNSPQADLVIGLDELTAPQADAAGLLVPYAPPALRDVPVSLVNEVAPDHAVTPYEYGFLGMDYNPAFLALTHGDSANASLTEYAQNGSWGARLTVEDPTTDITGEEFLVWQIELYSAVLHQDWRTFWSLIDPHVGVAPDWSTAFGNLTNGTVPQAVVSYTTDVAYGNDNGTAPWIRSTVSLDNGTFYGWKTIYGIGIVKGSTHLTLDQEFIDWFLSGTVQSLLPTNEWEYPANATISLPPEFGSALSPSSIHPLNDFTSPAQVAANLPAWLTEWQAIANGGV